MQSTEKAQQPAQLVAHYLAYSFLGKAFFEEPSIELITRLRDDALFADWPLDSSNEALQSGLDILQNYCAAWDAAAHPELKRDYARLFIGPDKLTAPPWESVYRSKEHLLFEEQTLQVRAMYHQYGMALPGGYIQPDDHFGLEMFFVAHLCQLALNAIEQNQPDSQQALEQALVSFFKEHICQWAEQYLQDVQASAETAYYQGLALLAAGCIAHTTACWHINEATPDIA